MRRHCGYSEWTTKINARNVIGSLSRKNIQGLSSKRKTVWYVRKDEGTLPVRAVISDLHGTPLFHAFVLARS